MLDFLKCVAEAVVEKGVRGLADMVPGGGYAYDVAAGACKKYRERKQEAAIRVEIQELAQASFEDARKAAAEVAQSVAPGDAEAEIALELYLTQIPGAVRQSLKRPDDPTGKTVPAAFALKSPDDVLKLLPPRPPRFRPNDPLPGRSGWVLERPLGVGGFGEVWLAKHPRMAALVAAVKFCHAQQARDLWHEGDLINRVMQQGKHPHIVPLLDVNLEAEAPWLMFEYVPGGDLTDWIRALQAKPKEQRIKEAVAALRELAEAVGHFHQLPHAVVHRDLKPSNILIDQTTGRLRITDFGIGSVMARATLAEESRGAGTRGGRLLSYLRGSYTPLYSSPQQRNGDDPDPCDDVHALGVIGYQMITGHLTQGPGTDFTKDLRESGACQNLIDLIGDCVAQKQERRPKDAGDLGRLLAQIECKCKIISADELLSYVESKKGSQFATLSQGREFTVRMIPAGPMFRPASSSHETGVSRKVVQQVCDQYAKSGSTRPSDYPSVTSAASYILAIIDRFVKNHRTTPRSPAE